MNLNYRLVFIILLALGTTLLSTYVSAQSEPSLPFTKIGSDQRSVIHEQSQLLQLSDDFVQELKRADHSFLDISIPDHQGKWLELNLHEVDFLASDFKVSDKTTGEIIPIELGKFYVGTIKDQAGWASFSVVNDEVSAIISIQKVGNLNVGKLKDGTNDYIVYNDANFENEMKFDCHAPDLEEAIKTTENSNRVMDNCVQVYLEADYHLFQNKGGADGAANYLMQAWGPVYALFQQENIEVQISEIKVWTIQDPYSTENVNVVLAQFLNLNGNFNGDVAHLVSTNPNNLGGIAYIDALCTGSAYGYSNITNNFRELPDYSWTVNVITHEIGHSLGSPHTHSCLWPEGPLDNCEEPEGPCSLGPSPTNGGTIMSYCHLTQTGINFSNGFGQLPGDLIRERVAASSCLGACEDVQEGVAPTAIFTYEILSECVDGLVLFTDRSTGFVTNYVWEFEGADIETSNEASPIVNYLDPGEYSVTLTVSNEFGTSSEIKNNIIDIIDNPIVSYSYDFIEGTNQIQFASESESGDSWFWDFGDGNTSSEQNPLHEYSVMDDYNITLNVTNDCGPTQMFFELGASVAPQASLGSNTTTGCSPQTIQFFDLSSQSPNSFAWTFEGGEPSSSIEANPTIVYNTPGQYDVILQVSNGAGVDEIIITNYVNIDEGPLVDFEYYEDNGEIQFNNNTESYTDLIWDFGDGNTSTQVNPSHAYSQDGDFQVTLTAINECGSNEMTIPLEVDLYPNPAIEVLENAGCENVIVQFQDMSTNSTSIKWLFEGGTPSSSTESNPTIVYEKTGIFDVVLEAINDAGSTTEVFEDFVAVYNEPVVDFSYQNDGLSYVFNQKADFGDNYFWDFGDGNTSELPNPFHMYLGEGSYEVSLTVENECGVSTHQETVNLYSAPTAEVQISDASFCVNENFILNSNSSFNTASHSWILEGPTMYTSDEENGSFNIDVPGVYSLTYVAVNPIATDTIFLLDYINVVGIPESAFEFEVDLLQVHFDNMSTTADSYQWDFGDGTTSTEESPTHQYSENGTYNVVLVSFTACGVAEMESTVILDQQSNASFNVSQRVLCSGDSIFFKNTSNSASDSYIWHFPGAVPEETTEANPLVVFNEAGSYDVTLIAYNEASTDTLFFEDFINVDGEPELGVDTIAYSLTSVVFNVEDPSEGEYYWEFGDGESSTIPTPSHDYGAEGSYDVYGYFANQCGETEEYFTLDLYSEPLASFQLNNFKFCAPGEVELINKSSNNTTDWFWTIEGSVEGTSNEFSPIFHFENAGLYDVELIAVNPIGADTILINRAIEVALPPDIQVLPDINGKNVFFDNFTAWTDSFIWDFGDGNTSTAINPSHTYEEEGSYLVTVYADNFCGLDTMEFEINAFSPTIADFSASAVESCAPVTIEFYNQSSDNAFSYKWHFEEGIPATSTAKNPSIRYETSGSHDVMLIAMNDENSDTILLENYIYILPIPEALFQVEQNGPAFEFTNYSLAGESFHWDFGDGTTSESFHTNHVYNEPGTYTVILTAENNCGSNVYANQVISLEIPPVAFSSDVNYTCKDSDVQFYNLSAAEHYAFEWFFEGGVPSTSTEEAPVIKYPTPGLFDVQLIATSDLGTDTMRLNEYLQINDLPNVDFTVSSIGNIAYIENQVEELTSYVWLSNENVYQGNNPQISYSENGLYDIEVIAYNQCGTDTLMRQIYISAFPTAAGEFPVLVCAEDLIYFTDQSINQTSIEWIIDGAVPGPAQNNRTPIAFDEAGTYDVILVASNGWGTDTLFFEEKIEVLGNPVANFDAEIFDDQILFSDLSSYGQSYFWDFGDGNSSTNSGDIFHVYDQDGTYIVSQTITNSCGTDTFESEVVIDTVIISDLSNLEEGVEYFHLFPNPFSHQVTLDFKLKTSSPVKISIHNAVGSLIYQNDVMPINGTESILLDLQGFQEGNYILSLQSQDAVITKKLVKYN